MSSKSSNDVIFGKGAWLDFLNLKIYDIVFDCSFHVSVDLKTPQKDSSFDICWFRIVNVVKLAVDLLL